MSGKGGKRDPKREKGGDDRTNIKFKPAHIKRIVKKLTKMRVSRDTLRACSAGVSYILREILDGGKDCCVNEGKKKMSPRHINSVITSDAELNGLLKNYVIQSGGGRQFTHSEITKKN
ncbi:histone H2A [Pancytospora epiphaga]|nr:histone H2A [Pancytospora epiphaga]